MFEVPAVAAGFCADEGEGAGAGAGAGVGTMTAAGPFVVSRMPEEELDRDLIASALDELDAVVTNALAVVVAS